MTIISSNWQAQLRRVDWLADVNDEELAALPEGRSRACKLGQVIFSPSAAPNSVFFCVDGLVRIYRMWPDGNEVTLGYVGPAEVFGELGAFNDYPRESYAMAATRCTVCELRTDAFRTLMASHPEVLERVTKQIVKRLKRVESRVANLVFRDAFTRMCATLLELGEDFGVTGAGDVKVDIPLTQSEFATLVGTSRQTVNAGLKKLEDDAVVARRSQRFIVLDLDRLRSLAQGSPH